MKLNKGTKVSVLVVDALHEDVDFSILEDNTISLENVEYELIGYFQGWASVPYITELNEGQFVAFSQTKAIVLLEDGRLYLAEIDQLKVHL